MWGGWILLVLNPTVDIAWAADSTPVILLATELIAILLYACSAMSLNLILLIASAGAYQVLQYLIFYTIYHKD